MHACSDPTCSDSACTDSLDDPLTDFDPRHYTFDGVEKHVFVSGRGPAVVVLAEMPGISPHVARFARWIRQAGFSVYLPSLFGVDGAWPMAEEGLAVLRRACISAEFHALAGRGASPVTAWLRALARQALAECGGPGVGAPLDDAGAVESSAEELAAIRRRLEREDLCVLAYRFEGDRHCRAERFSAYRESLGERFVGQVLPDSAANTDPPPFFRDVVASPHSVLTAHLIDATGEPTLRARDEVLAFLRQRLTAARPADKEITA